MSFLAATIRLLTGDVRALDVAVVDPTGAHVPGFDSSRPAGSTTTSVPVSAVTALLAASNPARRQLIINNLSGKTLQVAFEATATVGTAVFPIPANTAWVSPLDGYTGDVSGILGSGTGNVNVTEVTTA